MKLFFHEKILGVLTLLFVCFIFAFSMIQNPSVNIASHAPQNAVPYLININTADISELDTLEGIGVKTAEAIIAYRNSHGGFKSVNELCEISGIGASTLDKIKEYIEI